MNWGGQREWQTYRNSGTAALRTLTEQQGVSCGVGDFSLSLEGEGVLGEMSLASA